MVDAQINGKTEHMLLDTGSITTVISPRAAATLGLKNFSPSPLVMSGVGGDQRDLPSIYLNVGLGGWQIVNTLVLVNAPDKELQHDPKGIDGAIGYNMLKPFDIDLDLPDAQLSLYLSQNCFPDVSPPPWPPPYGMTGFFERPDRESAGFIEIDNKPIPAVLDTGSDATIIPSAALKWAGIAPERTSDASQFKAFGYGPGESLIKLEKFDKISIGDEWTPHPWLLVDDENLGIHEAVIGDNYLRRHRVFISNSTNLVYFGRAITTNAGK